MDHLDKAGMSTPLLTCMEGHNTRPKIMRMEGDINAGERNCSEVGLKDNIALSILFPSIDTRTLTSTNSGRVLKLLSLSVIS
jgi:hypothetical protein